MPTEEKTLRNSAPQCGQMVRGGSVNFWTASTRWWHEVHSYS
jgi:hypothetical protein